MLVLGLTVLAAYLQKTTFIIYWTACFLVTGTAAIVALIDLAMIRREERRQQQALISETVKEAKGNQPGNSQEK